MGLKHLNRSGLLILAILIQHSFNLLAQEDFFLDDWRQRVAEVPDYIDWKRFPGQEGRLIQVHADLPSGRISPNLFGYCLNSFYGPYSTVPSLTRHIRNLEGGIYRIPAGSGSNYYFWDRSQEDGLPADADLSRFRAGLGDPAYMSLDNFYCLVYDTLQAQSVNVVNYSYARYGTSADPVAAAAGYAADWVRYDSGRTRYWEVGNENYGSWEEGYQIDLAKNQDGQPEIQTGRLYGQHFRVFADSMRRAASEIGSEIRIGAVGYWGTLWPGSRSQWNREMIPECGAVCDFISIHQYFSGGGTSEILQSAATMNEGPLQIYQWFDQYSIPRVPIALTEWNLKKEISTPDCLNGMHAVLGIGNLARSGISMASRWNLVWSYNDGVTHGHISADTDYQTEGNRPWGPRAVFYYLYYARRCMGDQMLFQAESENGPVESFATSFSSGHTGIILVNKGDSTEYVTASIAGFEPGERYYWYELRGENDNPLSEKVLVNGITSGPEFRVGGPENYEGIPARSGLVAEGIALELRPHATAYVLVDGKRSFTTGKNVIFRIYGRDLQGEVSPIDGATLLLGSQAAFTDTSGMAHLDSHEGSHFLSILKTGFNPATLQFDLMNDTVIADTLQMISYDLQIQVIDAQTSGPIEGCSVQMEQVQAVTNSQGMALFQGAPAIFSLNLESEHYNPLEATGLLIDRDTTLVFRMEKRTYPVSVHLFDLYSGVGIPGARVILKTDTSYTDQAGTVWLALAPGTCSFTMEARDYYQLAGNVSISSDSILQFGMEPSAADVKFRLLKGTTPVNLATITLNETSLVTNSLGMATFSSIPVSVYYEYWILREGYEGDSGAFFLKSDTTIQVEMLLTGNPIGDDQGGYHALKIWPNPAGQTLSLQWGGNHSGAMVFIMDLLGRIVLKEQWGADDLHVVQLAPLQQGSYMVVVNSMGQSRKARFVK